MPNSHKSDEPSRVNHAQGTLLPMECPAIPRSKTWIVARYSLRTTHALGTGFKLASSNCIYSHRCTVYDKLDENENFVTIDRPPPLLRHIFVGNPGCQLLAVKSVTYDNHQKMAIACL